MEIADAEIAYNVKTIFEEIRKCMERYNAGNELRCMLGPVYTFGNKLFTLGLLSVGEKADELNNAILKARCSTPRQCIVLCTASDTGKTKCVQAVGFGRIRITVIQNLASASSQSEGGRKRVRQRTQRYLE